MFRLPRLISGPRSSDKAHPLILYVLLRYNRWINGDGQSQGGIGLKGHSGNDIKATSSEPIVHCQAYQPNLKLLLIALAANSHVVCVIEKGRWLGRLSAGFGNYLLQQNKICHNIFAINQVQQLFLFKTTNPRHWKALTFLRTGRLASGAS